MYLSRDFRTMKEREYQICTRCVMDTTDPIITFNDKGECNHCTEFINKRAKHQYDATKSEPELEELIKSMKIAGKGKDYDCIIGISGGVDSSYAVYLAKQRGLRVLGVHLDNGWNSEEAVQNILNIAKLLEIDYESYVLDWEEFRDLQLSFLKAGVPEAETPTDIAIQGAVHHFAKKYGVKYIISGGNFATEGILPKHWHYNAKDLTYLNHIQKKFGSKKLKQFPKFGFLQETYCKVIKGIKTIYLLNMVPYDKEKSMEFLKSELNWKYYGGKHYESKYTGFIQSYYLYEKFKIDYRRATFASQICNGILSRSEAMEELRKLPYNMDEVNREIDYISKKLRITRDELVQLIDSPPHWYADYPNDEKRLGFIYDTYRKIYKKEKLASF